MSRRCTEHTDPTDRTDRASGDSGVVRWVLAPLGLLLVGAGASVSIDAGLRRAAGAPRRRWVTQGAVGLAALNSGLSVFGDAVVRSVPRADAAPGSAVRRVGY